MTVGIGVSLACLYFATRGTDWVRVGSILAGARPAWLLVLVFVSLAAIYVRAQRWRVLLRPLGDVPIYPLLSATAIGFGASAVLPFRLGELVRPALLGRQAGVGMSAALSSVVLERLFDMLLVIACILGVSLMYDVPTALRRGALVLAGLAAAGFATLFTMSRHPEPAEALADRLVGLLPARLGGNLRPVTRSFLSGVSGLADGPTVLLVLAYSVYVWALNTLTFGLGFLALGIRVPFLTASLTTLTVVAAFVFLPQAPGFVGTWQAACVLALGFFGVSKDVAVGYSVLTWIVSMVVNIATAGVFLVRDDLSLGQLLRVAREAPATQAEG